MEFRSDVMEALAAAAWSARERAFVFGPTTVGCAVLSASGNVYSGCNVEHRFRCHDIHAEVNAIGSMVAAGDTDLRMVLIAAHRDRFTPCGGCMDWIMQFGSDTTVIAFQGEERGSVVEFTANELMPHYPI